MPRYDYRGWTMSTVKFVPKPGKPHIKIFNCTLGHTSFFLYVKKDIVSKAFNQAIEYCMNANPDNYATPGEAARALFNYRGEDK